MTGVGASVTVDDTELRAELARVRARLANMLPVMRSIGQTLRTNVDLGFRGEHDPWDRAWRPLSRRTLAQRRGTSAQILRDTGRLANSMTYRADRNSVSVGTNVEYAEDHQFGVPARRVPIRAMLPIRNGQVDLPQTWKDDILDILAIYLRRP